MAHFSVVIPAHNEEKVIGRCLDFVAHLGPGEAEVVVVPNGCTDRTAEVAAAVPGVTVVDLPEGAKWRALNAGDAAATAFPRIYLDADIVLSAETLRALAGALGDGRPRVAAPRVQFRVEGRPYAVRAFYAAYERLPYVRNGLTGLGVFALSEEGRARFGEFPNVTADDLYVQRLFTLPEREVLQDVTFLVELQ
jgi:glycosyltransferase involved in cell wall biosynthesis